MKPGDRVILLATEEVGTILWRSPFGGWYSVELDTSEYVGDSVQGYGKGNSSVPKDCLV